jgi:uncharacterized protein YbcI
MSESPSGRGASTPISVGSASTAISNGLSKLHREYFGRGPDAIRTMIGHDHVITFLENLYTPSERTLLDAGETETVVQSRLAFQRAMKAKFIDCVEQATGRKVRAFLSQVHMDPDISAEIFVLERDDTNAAPPADTMRPPALDRP